MIRELRGVLMIAMALGAIGCSDALVHDGTDGPGLQLSVHGPAAVTEAEQTALSDAFDQVDNYRVTIVDAQTLEPVADLVLEIEPNLAQHVLEIPVEESDFGRTVRITLIAFSGDVELYRSVTVTTLDALDGTASVDAEIRYSGPGIRGAVKDVSGSGVGGVSVNLFREQALLQSVTTEPDGTYLFLDVDPGPYEVAPTAPNQTSTLCPGLREVTLETTETAVKADFTLEDDVCETSVLVLSGGDVDDTDAVAALLSQDPALTVSTFFFLNDLPGLETLSQHDAVLVFMNGLFDESVRLGDQLAGYVSEGGNVVVASFYWQGRSDGGFGSTGWGALENVDPLTSTGGATYEAGELQSTVSHPLTSGVTVLGSTAYWGGAAAKEGTTVVATWSDGSPLVAYRVLPAGQRLVGVTLFPASGESAFGDIQTLWQNAVSWAGAAGGPVP